MKKVFIFASLLLSACSAKHVTFYPTSSPCVDSLSANFSYAKCSRIEQKLETSLSDPEHPLMELKCVDPAFKTEWTENTFYVMSSETPGYVSEYLMPVCMDINSMVFVRLNTEQGSEESD
tara:strand:+ start:5949 stop:6308 length:360 start_codon:yes stop_codon:yes gene_type:complete